MDEDKPTDAEIQAFVLEFKTAIHDFRHSYNEIIEMFGDDELTEAQQTIVTHGRNIIEMLCDCNNPKQCNEPCGDLGHSVPDDYELQRWNANDKDD